MTDFVRKIMDINVNFGFNMTEAVEKTEELLQDGKSHYICTTNPEFIIAAQKDAEFRHIVNNADLSLPDGIGVLYAQQFLNKVASLKKDWLFPVRALVCGLTLRLTQERISGVSLFHELCSLSSKKGYTVFLLGGWPKDFFGKMKVGNFNQAGDVAKKLVEIYPNLKIIGATSEFSPDDDVYSTDFIQKCMKEHGVSHIDFLFVAYGQVKQESWIYRNSAKIPAKVSIGVGGTFDYVAGDQKYAPRFFITHNLEWLYRLVTQPWRFGRIFNAFPLFPYLVYKSTLKNKN